MSTEQVEERVAQAKAALAQDPEDGMKRTLLYISEYEHSKYVRQDNRPSYADFLGYLNARELYPDFKPIAFREFFAEVLAGKAKKVYANS